MSSYKLLCLENPLLDIQAEATDLLEKYSLKPNDAILAEPAEKYSGIYADLQSRKDVVLLAGGAAQNTARGAQYLLPPSSVMYLGCVGQDDAAATLDEACKKAGLATEYLRTPDHPTGRCGVVINGHNRSMVTDLGAANHYTLEHLQSEKIWGYVKKAEVFYVGGYHLTVSPEAAIALGKEAAARNVPFVFGMGAPFIAQFFTEPLKQVWGYCDYTFGNETEATAWAEAQGLENKTTSPEDIKAIAKAMALFEPKVNAKRGRTCVITQGTQPTVVAVADGKGGCEISEFPVHVIGKEEIVDTTGAGDAFAGGFLAGLVEGKELAVCVDMGMWLAAKSLKELGPSYPLDPKQTYKPTSSN